MANSALPLLPNLAVIDDHVLLRKGLCELIHGFGEYTLVSEANNGKDFIQTLHSSGVPAIVLMDINMPEMDGYQTTEWLKLNHPEVRVLALSMYDSELSIIRMLKAGARGYILKDTDPSELKAALQAVITKGYYYSEMVNGSLIHNINRQHESGQNNGKNIQQLNEKEITFLKLACSELTYKEIADQMFLSPRTIDGYRDNLFQKLDIKTRVGLVLYAIKNGIVNV